MATTIPTLGSESPSPQPIRLPRLLHGHIKLLGYPLPMVLAEKIVTAVQRDTANTRWRDFADLHLLSDRHDVDGEQLSVAVTTVARYRSAVLTPLRDLLADYSPTAQPSLSSRARGVGSAERAQPRSARLPT